MRSTAVRLCLTLVLCLVPVLWAHSEEPARPNVVPGLVLTPPQTVTAQVGYLKVEAQCDGVVVWDVAAEFDDAEDEDEVDFHWDYFSQDKKVIIVAIPAVPGQIVVRACGHDKAGKPIEKMATTVIDVEPKGSGRKKPRPGPTPPPPPAPSPMPPAPAPAPAPPAGVPAHLFLILDYDKGDPQVAKVASAPELAAKAKALGVRVHVLSSTSKVIEEQGLTELVTAAGGAPALVILTAEGDTLALGKLPADEAAILAAVKKAGAK